MYYVPLPGLSTRLSKDSMSNYILPYKQSPFIKLIASNPIDHSLNSKSSLALFSSPSIQAIVKFKWHAYARWCWMKFIFFCLLTMMLFTAAVHSEGESKKIWIATMIFGAILTFTVYRGVIAVNTMNIKEGNYRSFIRYLLFPSSYFIIITFGLPFIVSFLEINDYFGFGSDDNNRVCI